MMLIIQGQMGVMRTRSLGFLVILLCVSLAVRLYYRKVGEKAFLNQLVDPATGEIDENQAELLWISCRQHLNDMKEAPENPKLHLLDKTCSTTNDINTKGHSLIKENIQNLINALHPRLKQALSDCVRKNNLLFKATGEDSDFKTWYTRCFESLFHCLDVPRRTLATHDFSPPSRASLHPTPSDEADLLHISSPTHRDSEHEGTDNSTTIIVACVMTSAVTSVVAALFFFLCCNRDFRAKQNDEKPLLSLSLSEFSCGIYFSNICCSEAFDKFFIRTFFFFPGSSHAYAFGSNEEEKLGHQLFGNESSLHKKASTNGTVYIESDALQISLDEESLFGAVAADAAKALAESSDTSGNTNFLLPLPPGRVSTSPTVLPPLKYPPGRADPLPPEPPAPIRASPHPPPPPPPPPTKPASVNVSPRPPGPPLPPGAKAGPRPPPPPSTGLGPPRPPPPMPLGSKVPRPLSGPKRTPNAISGEGSGSTDDAYASKAKLKPFFWDKVAADADHSMVWNQLKAGSFQFNEEMIETLFGYASVAKDKSDGKKQPSAQALMPQFIQLIDPKKAQNLAILLRALNVTTEEVCDALREGNELPVELIQTILKMAPTADEELKLRLFNGEISQLGPAERFLKVLVDIPFAFKRLKSLLFMCTLHEEVTVTKESFETLEVACKELRSSRLFLKLLEAVLKTGNRMNDGTFRGCAQAFKLDTLLKLSDVKGVDGKTTLLHFVVQEIIRTEGLRAARLARESKSFTSIKSEDLLEDVSPDTEENCRSLGLQVVSRLSSELENIKKAAALDAENLTGTVAKLSHGLLKARDFLSTEMKSTEEESGFHKTLESFVKNAEPEVMWLLEEEKRIMALVKSTGDYFHGNTHKNEGLRLFVIVRDFLIILDKVCKEVRDASKKPVEAHKRLASNASPSSESRIELPSPDPRKKLFPAIAEQRMDNFSSSSSSDEES